MRKDKTPEIIALPIVSGSDDYLEWLNDQLKSIDG
ncbi:MAG: divalent cation tolerance protein CutA [Deltaproteobacteria bacterium]|nr:divalent cation tolerance protein CutA [Deltaproteobacteria bacterium]